VLIRWYAGSLLAAEARRSTAEEALAAKQHQFQDFLDRVPTLMFARDLEGRYLLANRALGDALGVPTDEIVGQLDTKFVSKAASRGVRDNDLAIARSGVSVDEERTGTGSGGETRLYRVIRFPLLDASGVTYGVGAVSEDITERRMAELERVRLQEEMGQLDRLKSLGQLAGSISHDFNNLLGVILNYATLLEREVTDPTASADLGEIRTAAERAAALTRQLLTFARRDVVDPEPLDVNAVIRDITELLGRTLGERVELRLRLAEKPLVAVIDRHQLDQVVLNLAINARDAMSTGGVLTIATRHDSGRDGSCLVVLSITDDGEGMAPDVAERAFEPFFSTKPTGAGTGLGLSTVYGIVQQNQGDVMIDSVAGLGTTITVVLPCATEANPVSAETRAADGDGSERILLVEDEDPLREATARLLRARGYDVVTAGDGIEALDVMDREERPMDLVVTDVAMPRLRGDELAERLAVIAPEVPVLFVSGYDSGEAPQVGRLLPKPVAEQDLLRAVREVLDG
jgi:PAS domain S-box-containing protein